MDGATDDLATWPGPIVQQAAAQIGEPSIVQRAVAQIEPSAENPKTTVGRMKAPTMSVVPATSLTMLSEAHLDGAIKYGPFNWREKKIPLLTYIDAAMRHLMALREGEDVAPDSGILHAAHVMAGMSIVIDAAFCGTLIDDRVLGRPDAFEAAQAEVRRIRAERAARDAVSSL